MQQCIRIYYSMYIWNSTCVGRHTAPHQEFKTKIAASGFAHVKGWWTLSLLDAEPIGSRCADPLVHDARTHCFTMHGPIVSRCTDPLVHDAQTNWFTMHGPICLRCTDPLVHDARAHWFTMRGPIVSRCTGPLFRDARAHWFMMHGPIGSRCTGPLVHDARAHERKKGCMFINLVRCNTTGWILQKKRIAFTCVVVAGLLLSSHLYTDCSYSHFRLYSESE
jgi:hypothetical protein